MGFYDDMQAVATDVLREFKQGTVVLTRITAGAADPETSWIPGTPTTASYTLDAVVRRVEQKYVDGSLIVATDNQIITAVPPVGPAMTDQITIDGVAQVIKDIRPIPAAGTPVAYIIFVQG